MTDKRAEALERARALRARYDSATTVHPSTYAQLADAGELLALHAENQDLRLTLETAESWCKPDHRCHWASEETKKLTADNADLVDAAAHARGLLADDYFENWEQAHDILHDVITRPHPGHALLQRIEKLEAIADKARVTERVYWDFEKSMKAEVLELKKALEALDGENKS